MSREEFMKELEYLLQDIKEEERSDALAYYRDYLEEAGPENEEKVLQEFGSPEKVAAVIRASISGNMTEGGEYTEAGYGDERFREPGYQVVASQNPSQETNDRKENNEKEIRTNRGLKIFLWGVLILVAAPVIFSVGGGIFSLVAGIAVVVLVMFFCIAIFALMGVIGGIAAMVGGGVYILADPLNGGLIIGIGLLAFGVGIFLLLLSVWFYGKAIPAVVRSILDLCNRLVHRVRRRA